jgi:hypothetical protein
LRSASTAPPGHRWRTAPESRSSTRPLPGCTPPAPRLSRPSRWQGWKAAKSAQTTVFLAEARFGSAVGHSGVGERGAMEG